MPKVVNEIRCIQIKIDNRNSVGKCVMKGELKYGLNSVKDPDKPNARTRFAESTLKVRYIESRGRTSCLQ